MTSGQRLRELVAEWTSAAKATSSYQEGKIDARNRCAAELEAILNEESEGWLPIEMAPKDGSVVLVNDTTGAAPWCAAKFLDHAAWSGWIYDDELALDANPTGPEPTHFMYIKAATTRPADGSEK